MFLMKRIWVYILALLLIMMMTSAAVGETVISVSNDADFVNAVTTINANRGEYIISLQNDIKGFLDLHNPNAVVTLVGNRHTLSHEGQVMKISKGVLNLGDGESELILASTKQTSDEPGLVYVLGSDAICNMKDKVTIRDGKTSNYFGGGVTVQGGTFHMYGGMIQNCGVDGGSVCYGGGVAVYSGGTFIMDSGTIERCYATTDYIDDSDPSRCKSGIGGGVLVSYGSSFVMNGGKIADCKANYGAGVALVSSYEEIYPSNYGNIKSLVEINNGEIINNVAKDYGGAIFTSGYFYIYSNSIGTPNPDVGASDRTGLYIKGGIISENAADAGGGIFLIAIRETPKQHVQIHNATITGNTAFEGAGIEINSYWTAAEIKDCTITENEAKIGNDGDGGFGGGIAVFGNDGTQMLGTNILCNNTAKTQGADAYISDGAAITFTSALAMNQTYHNSGIRIDGWYDDTDPRWSAEKASGTGNTFLGDVYELVNKTQGIIAAYTYHEPTEMPLTISLNWDDQDNVDLLRPYGITVRLTDRNGNLLKQTNGEDAVFTLTARDGWRKSLLMVPFDVNTMKVVAEVVEDYTQLEPKVVINADGSISIEMTNQHIPEVTPEPSDTPTPLPTETPELTPAPGEEGESEDIPDTGDKSNVGVWALLAGFSVVGIVFLITYRRNRRK